MDMKRLRTNSKHISHDAVFIPLDNSWEEARSRMPKPQSKTQKELRDKRVVTTEIFEGDYYNSSPVHPKSSSSSSPKTTSSRVPIGQVRSYCMAESFDMTKLRHNLASQVNIDRFRDVLRLKFPQSLDSQDIFIFRYGVVVFWGYKEEFEQVFLMGLEQFANGIADEVEEDDLDFCFEDVSSFSSSAPNFSHLYSDHPNLKGNPSEEIRITDDQIILGSNSPLIKLSISFGIAQSTKLSVFERKIASIVEKNQIYVNQLARDGRISLTQKELSQKLGFLMAQKNLVNLHTDILDIPEFFWENDDSLLKAFTLTKKYLDVTQRTDVLNQRMSLVKELFELLRSEQQTRHSVKLEIIVIVLIVVEVVLEILLPIMEAFLPKYTS
eukprot:TRINITY_DN4162_c0_g1_i1.p1 TRINITY_DN4162_c0_g1~~TRINITY_DN4162_c0_g1_i1.p1  ORF type:complete len:412 (+),score=170.41 TRINITY_DN4162_c0_g1_i1:91-1236(+)